jgi:hypothetical protein
VDAESLPQSLILQGGRLEVQEKFNRQELSKQRSVWKRANGAKEREKKNFVVTDTGTAWLTKSPPFAHGDLSSAANTCLQRAAFSHP